MIKKIYEEKTTCMNCVYCRHNGNGEPICLSPSRESYDTQNDGNCKFFASDKYTAILKNMTPGQIETVGYILKAFSDRLGVSKELARKAAQEILDPYCNFV